MIREQEPLVSIGMPVFNSERTLATAIRSIVNQTYQNWELILIDDGSRDRTLRVAREFMDRRMQVVEGATNLGMPTRLNEAVLLAKGVFFARMDGDDVAYPRRLERQAAYLVSHPDVSVLGTAVMVFRGEGSAIGVRGTQGSSHAEICARPQGGFKLAHPTWMGRLSWFRTRPYWAGAALVADQDLLLRTHSESRFECLPEILLGYREERISARKNLRYRYWFSKALLCEAWRRRSAGYLAGIPEQLLKAAVDMVAIGTGLNYKLLRHRAYPARPPELREWETVWAQCGGAGGGQD
jgi:glycosyltransferase involved in cell wall biosynthesis